MYRMLTTSQDDAAEQQKHLLGLQEVFAVESVEIEVVSFKIDHARINNFMFNNGCTHGVFMGHACVQEPFGCIWARGLCWGQ